MSWDVLVGFDTNKWLGFLCLTSISLMPKAQQFFLTLGVLSMIEDDKRMREICREDSVLGHLTCIELFTLYTKSPWSMLYYFSLP